MIFILGAVHDEIAITIFFLPTRMKFSIELPGLFLNIPRSITSHLTSFSPSSSEIPARTEKSSQTRYDEAINRIDRNSHDRTRAGNRINRCPPGPRSHADRPSRPQSRKRSSRRELQTDSRDICWHPLRIPGIVHGFHHYRTMHLHVPQSHKGFSRAERRIITSFICELH